LVTDMAAAADANSAANSASSPLSSIVRKAPLNQSPAPVASTSCILKTLMGLSWPSL